MKKFLCLLLAALLVVGTFAACSGNAGDDTTALPTESTAPAVKKDVNIAVLKGPTGMGAAKLMEMNENNEALNNYNFTVATAPDQIMGKLVSKELDIASIPTNAASALYNKTKGNVTLIAINTLGVLYILEKGDSVSTVADLKGKTILASGKGSTAEYVLNFILEKNGLKVGTDVTVEYAAEHAEAASQAISGNYDIVMLPEPFVTSTLLQSSDFKVKLNLTEEWKKVANAELTMGCVAVRTDFLKENPEAVENFLKDYKTSVDFVNSDVEGTAALIEKYDIAKAAVAKKALPNCNIVLITGEDMKKDASQFLSIIYDFDASAVGGALPEDSFYYIGK